MSMGQICNTQCFKRLFTPRLILHHANGPAILSVNKIRYFVITIRNFRGGKMKYNKVTLSIILLSSVLCFLGCASKGFNRGELQNQVGVIKPVHDDKEIKDAFDKKPNLPKAFKVGVYFKSPERANKNLLTNWRWTEEDKAILETVVSDLKKDGIVSDVFPIQGSLVADEDLKSLRLAAAKHHADALLVIGGAGQIDRYINGLGWTYALLLPALFVPGSEAETLFITNASLWDVRNEYLYLSAETEATTKKTYIAAFGQQDKDLLNDAKTKSLMNLKDELSKMIKGKKL
jgi:hypothetical protein